MSRTVSRGVSALRPMAVLLSLAAACGGAVTGSSSDASTDFGAPPVPYDASAALEAGSGLSRDLNSPDGSRSSGVSFCPSSCRVDADCAFCALPPGSNSNNCCVMGICALLVFCPTVRDSGPPDGAPPPCKCSHIYGACGALNACGCCTGEQLQCSGTSTCIPRSTAGDAELDAADGGGSDADGAACTTVYQPCDAQVCCEGMRCLGNGTCLPIP
jgi:hypothetical protein